ncbi:MAG: DUF4129 domain-containing protein [Elainellaceae cyanobacterium]
MTGNSFAEDGAGWQLQQLQQRASEWAEFQLLNDPPDIPLDAFPTIPGWVVRALLWLILGLAVAWLLWIATQIARPVVQQWLAQRQAIPSSIDRSQAFPGAAVWIRRSQNWQRQGNYRQACRALYMAMLEHLHETQQVPRSQSRTDGQYKDHTRFLPQPEAYGLLLTVHEQLCFGNSDISLEVFQRCQRAYQLIKQGIDPAPGSPRVG